MRRQYRRRAGDYATSGHSLFGGTGWLFADLLLALALAFLLATTVGPSPSPPTPKPTPSPAPTPSPTVSPTHPPKQPPLELDPVSIKFTISDPAGLVAGSPSAVKAVRNTILKHIRGIRNRSAGIVLLFGGDESGYPTYVQVDKSVENVLKSLSGTGPLFHRQTRYVHFLDLTPATAFSMDVYLFSRTS